MTVPDIWSVADISSGKLTSIFPAAVMKVVVFRPMAVFCSAVTLVVCSALTLAMGAVVAPVNHNASPRHHNSFVNDMSYLSLAADFTIIVFVPPQLSRFVPSIIPLRDLFCEAIKRRFLGCHDKVHSNDSCLKMM